MVQRTVLGWMLAFAIASIAHAAEPAPPAVERAIRANNPDLNIRSVMRTPIPGLYEVVVGRTIYYVDAKGHYLIAGGHMFDTRTKQDLTRARLEEINRVAFSSLPLELAIVSGDPKAKRAIAIFTDPDCPFCRRLERELKKTSGIKVYSLLFPLERIHPNARRHAEAIWCAKDRRQAMERVMLEGADLSPPKGCKAPIDRILRTGMRLGVTGTPTIVADDGRMHAGFMTAEELQRWLKRQTQ